MTDGICPFAAQVAGVASFTPGYVDRVGFCDHTAGGFYSTLTSASFWNQQGLSVHFAIARDGRIAQILNIFDTAYAQGIVNPPVTWAPYPRMAQGNPNTYLISTEHEDAETVNGQTHFIPGSEWTDAQYAADLRVKRWCIDEVKRVKSLDLMRFGIDSLAGHYMFDPVNRAACPGHFWHETYRDLLWEDLQMPAAPTDDDQIKALVALAHFIRNGWNLADLSAEDKAAIAFAAGKVPA